MIYVREMNDYHSCHGKDGMYAIKRWEAESSTVTCWNGKQENIRKMVGFLRGWAQADLQRKIALLRRISSLSVRSTATHGLKSFWAGMNLITAKELRKHIIIIIIIIIIKKEGKWVNLQRRAWARDRERREGLWLWMALSVIEVHLILI